ncbi:MAG: alpha/beta fold hydrolase [Nocardioides sp.]|jgi:pimeloyl-ACP methyl ester carboxylesterase
MLVSARVGQFFVGDDVRDRLEYTEFGSGPHWVVLLHGQMLPRRMHEPLAMAMASEGFHVVTLDLLGHGGSDRPADPHVYSMAAFAEQVIALLDHLGAEEVVLGGTSLGANVSLETAVAAPDRVKGLLLEMPVLNNALDAVMIAFGPLLFAAKFLPISVNATRKVSRTLPRDWLPFWLGIGADALDQRADSMAALMHGVFFGRVAPHAAQRRKIQAPALVVGHPRDPIHPAADAAMLADELPHGRFVRASGLMEWRLRPERLTAIAVEFARDCWDSPAASSATGG